MNKMTLYGLLVLFISALACEPVIAIGTNELLCILAVIAILLGPPIYRLIRRIEEFLSHEKKDK